MKIQILQGRNFESHTTAIKITTDTTPKTEILDMIKAYHPVFMDSYQVENNTITIYSKLPHLWKESAETLNKLATGDWDLKKAKDYILNEVIHRQVLSMSTIPLLHSAMKNNYEITQFYLADGIITNTSTYLNRHYCIGCGRESHVIVSFAGTGDSHVGQKTQKDKWLSNMIIERLGLPLAKWMEIISPEHLQQVFGDFPKPFVLKPTGLVGGSGVSTGITTLEKALIAYDYAKQCINAKDRPIWQKKIMIQQQVEGEDYRILVVGGKVTLATKRIPAFVVGDGTQTIRQLIDETNKDPRRDETNPTHVLKPIDFDEMLDRYLAEQNLTLDHIPAQDEKVRLRKPASMSLGGITEDFTEKVHPQIKAICETIASSIHAFVLGVDVLCKDLSKPLTVENGSIIEINTMPEAYLNAFPVIGKQYPDIGDIYFDRLFADSKDVKRIISIGEDFSSEDQYKKLLADKGIADYENIGVYQDGKIYINGELIKDDLSFQKGVEALKINASLDVIIISHKDIDSVLENGTGFDEYDYFIGDEEISSRIK